MATRKKQHSDEPQINIYDILNKWLYDNSSKTPVPEEVLEAKNLSQMLLLYHFFQSKYIVYLSEVFNNYHLYQLDKESVFKFLKECIIKSNFRPRFLSRTNDNQTKIEMFLRKKYPYLKKDDVKLLVESIEDTDYSDSIYEMIGISKIKKKKNTKAEFEKALETSATETLSDILESFE